jgi:ribosomal protein S18 acetylase RimI-like enzyme
MLGVRVAARADQPGIISVLTLAFADDPACRRLYPDPSQYMNFFPEFVRLYGGRAFDHGGAYFVEGHSGAALWIPPGVHTDDEALEQLLERSVEDAAKPELFDVYSAMKRHHPKEPHWFLPLIGIDPYMQGQGHGMTLMSYGLTACDRDHMPAYLDSTHPRNIPFYERLGFELLATIQIGGHPPVYPMLRQPR